MAAYTTIDDPEKYFQVVTYTGNYTGGGSSQDITLPGDTDMQPDLVWIKNIKAEKHCIYDAVRGATKNLSSNSNAAESTDQGLTAFNSDGFTVATLNDTNENATTIMAFSWKAGTTSSGTTTGSGTGTAYSTSINDTAGFQITTYTGNDTGGHTIPVALSTAPHLMIFKQRNDSYTWGVYHHKNTSAPETEVLEMDGTGATADNNTFLNDVAPTSSVVTLGPQGDWGNEDGKTIVAYFWSEKQGYSKFGSYTGNGNADGPFIYTGFRPAWIMFKRTDASGEHWYIHNNKRLGYNPDNNPFYANDAAV